MRKSKGFTLIELLIVMAVIAILIAIAIPSVRGVQQGKRNIKAQEEIRSIMVAIESYYKNHNNEYPAVDNYQTTLLAASPRMLEGNLYDPFGATSTTTYIYALSTDNPTTAKYYIIYSVGLGGNGTALVDSSGTVTASNDAIWESNGHL